MERQDVTPSAPPVEVGHAVVREGLWYEVFAVGHPVLVGKQRRYARLPLEPRCKLCKVPFRGVGWVMRRRGWRPSPRNPDYCSVCDLFICDHEGVADLVMPVLFADLCNSAAVGSRLSNADYSVRRRVYRSAIAAALRKTDGFILEETGDQVVGVFPPGLVCGPGAGSSSIDRHQYVAQRAFACGQALVGQAMPQVHARAGLSFAASVHIGDVRVAAAFRPDGTGAAVEINGPPVNVAARLASAAAPGEVLVTDTLLRASGLEAAGCERRRFEPDALRGISELVEVRVLRAD